MNGKNNSIFGFLSSLLIMAVGFTSIGIFSCSRDDYYEGAVNKVIDRWGKKQVVQGISSGVQPTTNEIEANVKVEYRQISVHKVPIYTVDIKQTATFDVSEFRGKPDKIYSNFLESRKIVKYSKFEITGENYHQVLPTNLMNGGLVASLPVLPPSLKTVTVFITMTLKGGKEFLIVGSALKNNIKMHANWDRPIFLGKDFADYTIANGSFDAKWNTSFDRSGKNLAYILEEEGVGVDFFEGNNVYRLVQKVMKYDFFFVLIALMVFSFILNQYRASIDFFQYVIPSAILVTFNLTLLAFSEHIGFFWSYILSTAIVILSH